MDGWVFLAVDECKEIGVLDSKNCMTKTLDEWTYGWLVGSFFDGMVQRDWGVGHVE